MSLIDALMLDAHRINVWIAVRPDSNKGCGTQSDPYNAQTAEQLDAILNTLPAYTTVHLGPGIFKTKGVRIESNGTITTGWQIKRGWKLVGSGVQVTTLQLDGATTLDAHYYAVGHDFENADETIALADHAEVCELTIDCNLGGSGTVACGAVRLKGNHSRIRRVVIVNWGTKSTATPCVAVASVISDPNSTLADAVTDAGIEECVALGSNTASSRECTLFYVGNVPGPEQVAESFGRNPFIRNCHIDPGDALKDADIKAKVMGSCIQGKVEGNQVHRVRTGGPFLDNQSIRSIVVQGNVYRDVAYGTLWDVGQFSGAENVTGLERDGAKGWFTAASDMRLIVGDRIKITGGSGAFDGIFEVTKVNSATEYEYSDTRSSAGPTTGNLYKVIGIDNAEVKDNVIELRETTSGSPPIMGIHIVDGVLPAPPPYSNGSVRVVRNQIHYVNWVIGNGYSGRAIQIRGVKNVQVQDNTVNVDPANPIRDQRNGEVGYFNNRTPEGTLIRGYKDDTDQLYNELETDAEDALVLALFNRR